MSKPSISIIIPAYNAQEYIRECLESVLAQTFTDFEVIVVNDGSTDSTLEIANEFAAKDARIRILSQKNQGVSYARNKAIEASNSEWVTFLDSDDTLPSNGLQRLYDTAIASNTKLALGAFSRNAYQTRPGTTLKYTTLSAQDAIELTLYQSQIITFNPSAWGKLFHRSILPKAGFTPDIRYEDLDFFYQAFYEAKRISVTNAVVYLYRDNQNSFVNTFSTGRLDVLKVTSELERYISAHLPEILPAARDRRLSANFNIFALLGINTKPHEFIDQKQSCWNLITAYRKECLLNPNTRLKNKLGALLSFCGQRIFTSISRLIYT